LGAGDRLILRFLEDFAVSDASSPQRRKVLYEGMVQGVGFRYTARRIASRYAVTGYVRNLADGRVELVAEGMPRDVEGLLEAIGDQMGEYIRHFHVTVSPATGQFHQFDIRF
jgi:acylphosphatase